MKRNVISMILILTFLFILTACFPINGENAGTSDSRKVVRVGYLTGPTGMGMAKLIIDNNGLEGGNENYSFTKYADTQAAKADLAAGKIDVICLPTNEAALYQKNIDKNAQILAVNCLNSLYLISEVSGSEETTSSLEAFDGKTIYTCKNGTPRIVLEYLLKTLKINANVSYTVDGKEMITPADVSAQMIAGNIPNAVLPEPLITTITMKINSMVYLSSSSTPRALVKPVVNLSDEWAKVSDKPITMGCIVARGDFVNENKYTIDLFLEEYKASIAYISAQENFDSAADYINQTGILPSLPQAIGALGNLKDSIVFIDGEDMKNSLIAFYSSLGIALPDESAYYEK